MPLSSESNYYTPESAKFAWAAAWQSTTNDEGLPQSQPMKENTLFSNQITDIPVINPMAMLSGVIRWINLSNPSNSQIFSAIQNISKFASIEVLDLYSEFLKSNSTLLREGAVRGIISYLDHNESIMALSLLERIATSDPSFELRRLAQEAFEIYSL